MKTNYKSSHLFEAAVESYVCVCGLGRDNPLHRQLQSDLQAVDAKELARIISHEAGYDFASAGPTLQSKFSKAANAIIAAGWRKVKA